MYSSLRTRCAVAHRARKRRIRVLDSIADFLEIATMVACEIPCGLAVEHEECDSDQEDQVWGHLSRSSGGDLKTVKGVRRGEEWR